jgi:hypothetical protein
MNKDYRTKEELREIADKMNLSLEDLLYKMVSSAMDEIKRKEELLKEYEQKTKRKDNKITHQKNQIKKLRRKIKIKDAWAQAIKDCLYGYDGYENSLEGLKGLVDEAIEKARKIINEDDKSIVYTGVNKDNQPEHHNILFEELKEFTKEDQEWINSESYKRFFSIK